MLLAKDGGVVGGSDSSFKSSQSASLTAPLASSRGALGWLPLSRENLYTKKSVLSKRNRATARFLFACKAETHYNIRGLYESCMAKTHKNQTEISMLSQLGGTFFVVAKW